VYYGGPPTTMDAILATIVDGGQAIILNFSEAVKFFFSPLVY
jgi:hypothetical protein